MDLLFVPGSIEVHMSYQKKEGKQTLQAQDAVGTFLFLFFSFFLLKISADRSPYGGFFCLSSVCLPGWLSPPPPPLSHGARVGRRVGSGEWVGGASRVPFWNARASSPRSQPGSPRTQPRRRSPCTGCCGHQAARLPGCKLHGADSDMKLPRVLRDWYGYDYLC